jgi:hypothetical protein
MWSWSCEDWYSVTNASEKPAVSIFRVHIQDSDNYTLIYMVERLDSSPTLL